MEKVCMNESSLRGASWVLAGMVTKAIGQEHSLPLLGFLFSCQLTTVRSRDLWMDVLLLLFSLFYLFYFWSACFGDRGRDHGTDFLGSQQGSVP